MSDVSAPGIIILSIVAGLGFASIVSFYKFVLRLLNK